jgi:hypothetical protein
MPRLLIDGAREVSEAYREAMLARSITVPQPAAFAAERFRRIGGGSSDDEGRLNGTTP